MMSNRIKVVFGIDMETDVGSFTPYYEGLVNGTPLLLDLFAKEEVSATFLFTGDSVLKHPEVARACLEAGHELGAHSLKHETVGDPLFELPGEKPLLKEEVFPRLKLNSEIIEDATGVRPTSFRSPRLWGSTAVTSALMKLGYKCDLSYPMYFYRKQFSPYFVDENDWTSPGKSDLLEIPNFADMEMKSNDPGLERDRDQWPLFRTVGAEYVFERAMRFDAFCQARDIPTVLCFYMHPWEFWPMPKSFDFGEATVTPHEFITKNCGSAALRQLEVLIHLLGEQDSEFISAADLYAEYFKNRSAR